MEVIATIAGLLTGYALWNTFFRKRS